MENSCFYIPEKPKAVLERLCAAGFQTYLVGGCVRDMVLGRQPHDWDIATSALPEQTKALFDKTIDTGLQHGTVAVMLEGQPFEVTTFRKETGYGDHRHPDKVTFVNAIEEDLARRDFTVNAMAYHPETGLIDPFDGLADCKKKILRCVGEPERRFREDALRILRGLRFAAKLGFVVERETSEGMRRFYPLLKEVSAERIQTELNGLLLGKYLTADLLLEYREILGFILPELRPTFDFAQHNPHHAYDVYGHLCSTAQAASRFEMEKFPHLQETVDRYRLELVLGAFLHDIGKPSTYFADDAGVGHFYGHPKAGVPLAKTALSRLKYSNRTREKVLALIEGHDFMFMDTPKAMNKLIVRYGLETVQLLQAIHFCDLSGQGTGKEGQQEWQESLALCAYSEELAERGECISLRTLAVKGQDLLTQGYPPDRTLGDTLNHLLRLVLEEKLPNEKAALLEESKKYLRNL